MNFDEAIASHSGWKIALLRYLKKPDGSLRASEIALDNRCDLGKWIHGEGAAFATLPEFAALKRAHARFHREAAEVVRKIDQGQATSDEGMLGASTPYAMASTDVVQAIIGLRRRVPQ